MSTNNMDYQRLRSAFFHTANIAFRKFAADNDLGMPTPEGLAQMSMSFQEMADQVLWFGFDVWPNGSGGDDDTMPTAGHSVTNDGVLQAGAEILEFRRRSSGIRRLAVVTRVSRMSRVAAAAVCSMLVASTPVLAHGRGHVRSARSVTTPVNNSPSVRIDKAA